jgi:anti-anti-sigma factor
LYSFLRFRYCLLPIEESLMTRQYRYIVVDRRGDVFCVRLSKRQFDESEIYSLSEELLSLISEEGCRKMALSLGPGEPQCLYSVFLAKLITLKRCLLERGGALMLCEVSPAVLDVFAACQLRDYFDFAPDLESAIRDFG